MSEKLTLRDISDTMRKLDICMLTTRNSNGTLESRPMSNNKDVDYTGDSYFFTLDTTGAAQALQENRELCLAYQGTAHLFSSPTYISVSGQGELIKDRAVMASHWVKDLDAWFAQGLDTPGLTLIHVKARHITYWHNYEEGHVDLGMPIAA